jgi:hypothetical protein
LPHTRAMHASVSRPAVPVDDDTAENPGSILASGFLIFLKRVDRVRPRSRRGLRSTASFGAQGQPLGYRLLDRCDGLHSRRMCVHSKPLQRCQSDGPLRSPKPAGSRRHGEKGRTTHTVPAINAGKRFRATNRERAAAASAIDVRPLFGTVTKSRRSG